MSLKLMEHDIVTEYCQGGENQNTDGLSRNLLYDNTIDTVSIYIAGKHFFTKKG